MLLSLSVKQIVDQWLERMNYDLGTASAMLKTRRYLYAAFMCQQAVEKGIKGWLAINNQRVPPIHNLRKLALLGQLESELSDEQIDLLEQLIPFAIKARYGSYKQKLSEICDRKMATELFTKTERLIRWLKEKMQKK